MLKLHNVTTQFVFPRRALREAVQPHAYKEAKISNGYGRVTSTPVCPGYGETVTVDIDFRMRSVDEKVFNQVVSEIKRSQSYQSNDSFRQFVNHGSYDSAGSSACGIFGWLVGGGRESYSNRSDQHLNNINSSHSMAGTDDTAVTNLVASLLVNNVVDARVTASVQITGMLLTPQPTILCVEVTSLAFLDATGNATSVCLIDQTGVLPVAPDGTLSKNSLAAGIKLDIAPIG